MAANMGQPVTDAEWETLKEQFPWLGGTSGYSEADLREALIDAFGDDRSKSSAARRELRRLAESNPTSSDKGDPMFEWEWIRTLDQHPELSEDPEYYRELLWRSFYAPAGDPERESYRTEWRRVVGPEDRNHFYYGDTNGEVQHGRKD